MLNGVTVITISVGVKGRRYGLGLYKVLKLRKQGKISGERLQYANLLDSVITRPETLILNLSTAIVLDRPLSKVPHHLHPPFRHLTLAPPPMSISYFSIVTLLSEYHEYKDHCVITCETIKSPYLDLF